MLKQTVPKPRQYLLNAPMKPNLQRSTCDTRLLGVVLWCVLVCVCNLNTHALRILVTNDDGIGSRGIAALALELAKVHDVVVVAPDRDQTGTGLDLVASRIVTNTTGFMVLRVCPRQKDGQLFGYAVDGYPVDAVCVGMRLFGKTNRFDLLVSGINAGENTGWAHYFSGTEAAARAAVQTGLPALAVSLSEDGSQASYGFAARFVSRFVDKIQPEQWKEPAFWSINIPVNTSQI